MARTVACRPRAVTGNTMSHPVRLPAAQLRFPHDVTQAPQFNTGDRTMDDVTKITSGSLIAAEKVNGTDVYNMDGEHLGSVEDIMIDKISGKAIYAIMSFGGFLGIGEKQHPLPWSSLTYDESKGGYVVNLDKRMLQAAPTMDPVDDFEWTPDYGRRIDKYYGAPTYW
jgi:sporulation protein YlmC with PRC-barrel domain